MLFMIHRMSQKLFVGRHIDTMHGFVSSVEFAHSKQMNFFQIFLSNPKAYNGPRQSHADLVAFKKEVDKRGIKFVVHANFMLNFCNDPEGSKHNGALKLLISDLRESVICGAIGVVIHMGKRLDMNPKVALDNYVCGVKKALEKTKDTGGMIILETGAGQGTEICTEIQELGDLMTRFTEEEQKRIGYCIDTCHIFAAGYDVSDAEYVDLLDNLISVHLKWNKVKCIHFNDSKCPLYSKKDRHADLGEGYIGREGLKSFAFKCFDKDVPIVLETPSDSHFHSDSQIKLVKDWFQEWKSKKNEELNAMG